MTYFVYLIGNYRGSKLITYIGYTNNLKKRVESHNSGKGAKFTHDVCNQKVKDILENYQPEQLPDDLLAKLEEISAAATSEDTLAVGKTSKAKRRRKFRSM